MQYRATSCALLRANKANADAARVCKCYPSIMGAAATQLPYMHHQNLPVNPLLQTCFVRQ